MTLTFSQEPQSLDPDDETNYIQQANNASQGCGGVNEKIFAKGLSIMPDL